MSMSQRSIAAYATRRPYDSTPFLSHARSALRSNLSSYDAWYVALAEALGCPLVTLDRKLSRAPGPTCDIIVPSRKMTGES